jgi:16S rRNA G966 N2-methylase RsmD
MSLVLEQNKLDVVHKCRSNYFNWKGQFTPEFIEYLLDCYANEDSVVADPFSGSGTVLAEAIKKGLTCVGFEINPSAYFMSKFYEYAMCTKEERNIIFNDLTRFIASYLDGIAESKMVYVEGKDYRESYANLIEFSSYIAKYIDKKMMPLMINILFLCEKDKRMTLSNAIQKNMKYMKDLLLSLPYTSKSVMANLGDARNIGLNHQNNIDLIITSPPYINVFNYHQNYRGIIECFGYDILKVANSEIGSNRKHRSNRFKTVVQYAMDMGHTIYNASTALKVGGKMILVVGRESMVRKTPFYNSMIIKDIINLIPCLQIESINTRQFGNRYGELIDEDIIVVQKCSENINIHINVFEYVGLKHITNALSYADKSLELDLRSILNKKELILESPIFN